MLLVASDPYLSSIRPLPKKQISELSDEVKSLILCDTETEKEEDEAATSDGESVSSSDSDLYNNM